MKISACMIIKNEAEMLPRCLRSIRWVDEIIIVDTGSTDRSIEIAKKFGVSVYECPWQDNFSLHRNQSIEHCTGDWFLIIDADEELVPMTDPKNLREYFDSIPPDISALLAHTTEIDNGEKTSSWFSYKFFRKKDFIEFQQIVHNEPVFKNRSAITDIKFNHFGYSLSADKMAMKTKRSENLLRQRMKDDPNDHVAVLYMMQTFFNSGRYAEARRYGFEYRRLAKKNNDQRYDEIAYVFMCMTYYQVEDYNAAYLLSESALNTYPNNIDLLYVMTKIAFALGNKGLSEKYANKYFLEFMKTRNSKPENVIYHTANDRAMAEITKLLHELWG